MAEGSSSFAINSYHVLLTDGAGRKLRYDQVHVLGSDLKVHVCKLFVRATAQNNGSGDEATSSLCRIGIETDADLMSVLSELYSDI